MNEQNNTDAPERIVDLHELPKTLDAPSRSFSKRTLPYEAHKRVSQPKEAQNEIKQAKTMMQYHEGQEVEAKRSYLPVIPSRGGWCKAKIVRWIELEARRMKGMLPNSKGYYEVEFLDGTRGVFDVDHIRAVYLGY